MGKRPSWMILFLFFTGFICGCEEKIQPGSTLPQAGPPVKAEIAPAEPVVQPLMYEAVGTVQARTAGTVSSKLMATVVEVKVKEGDRVKKGDVLVVLDPRQVGAQLEEAEAGLGEARKAEAAALAARDAAIAGAEQAASEYRRVKNLYKEEAATRQDLEVAEARNKEAAAAVSRAEAALDASRYRIKQAQASVMGVRVSRNDATVVAPYDGKIKEKMVEPGDLASPKTPFVVLEREGGFRVELTLPEAHIQRVRIGQKVLVTVPSLSESPLQGTVETIVPGADQKSRTFLIKVGLSEETYLRSGMFARVAVPVGEERVLLVPASSVVREGQLTGIYIVDEKGLARFRLIRTGRAYGDRIEVVAGLREGTQFIVKPPPQLVDGAKVDTGS
jgi:RND family efflux transporter MFP subunit